MHLVVNHAHNILWPWQRWALLPTCLLAINILVGLSISAIGDSVIQSNGQIIPGRRGKKIRHETCMTI